MIRVYQDLTAPQAVVMITPVLPSSPDLGGGALIPGPPCPCPEIVIPIYSESRNYYRTTVKCSGFLKRVKTTIYTKDEKPSGLTEEQEESWDAAWDEISHVTEDEQLRAYSKFETWNLNSVDQSRSASDACEVVRTKDEWNPGEWVENPGYATYTPETTINDTPVPDVPAVDLSAAFEGEFEVNLGNGSTTAMDDDGDSSSGHKTAWRWVIDLSDWPASREWPDGLVVQGRVVWQTITTTISSNEEVEPEKSTIIETESFRIEKDQPIWRGDSRVSAPTGSPGRGNSRVTENFIPPAFLHLLPFE
jgi:hypothetical protein